MYVAIYKGGGFKTSEDLNSIINTPSAVCFARRKCLFSWYRECFYSYVFINKTGEESPYEYRGYKLCRAYAYPPKDSPRLIVEMETPEGKYKKVTLDEWNTEIESALSLIDNLVENVDAYIELQDLRRRHEEMKKKLAQKEAYVETYKKAAIAVATPLDADDTPEFFCCSAKQLIRATITSNVKSLGRYSFNSCERLREVYCQALVPPRLSNESLTQISKGAILYVPKESLQLYKDNEQWRSRFAIIDIL